MIKILTSQSRALYFVSLLILSCAFQVHGSELPTLPADRCTPEFQGDVPGLFIIENTMIQNTAAKRLLSSLMADAEHHRGATIKTTHDLLGHRKIMEAFKVIDTKFSESSGMSEMTVSIMRYCSTTKLDSFDISCADLCKFEVRLPRH
jgi:hypothetical protein